MAPIDISGIQIYAETPIDDQISVCYNANADIQDMLTALRDDSTRRWPHHLRKKLRIVMSKCKVIESRIYYRDRLLLVPDDTPLLWHGHHRRPCWTKKDNRSNKKDFRIARHDKGHWCVDWSAGGKPRRASGLYSIFSILFSTGSRRIGYLGLRLYSLVARGDYRLRRWNVSLVSLPQETHREWSVTSLSAGLQLHTKMCL